MSTVFNPRSSDTNRYDRDVVLTATTAVAQPDFYKARSLWTDVNTPPATATNTTWVVS